MSFILFYLAILFAIFDWLAVSKKNQALERFAKPLTMVMLIAWVFSMGTDRGSMQDSLNYFFVGFCFSLAGDLFLLAPPERWFIWGLAAFLGAHIAFILGFGVISFVPERWLQSALFAIVLLAVGSVVVSKLISGIKKNSQTKLIAPLILYAIIISYMLFSASQILLNMNWMTTHAYLVSFGALFFYISDILNAWERFVFPIRNGRLIVMITYHLAQFGIALGAMLHFTGN